MTRPEKVESEIATLPPHLQTEVFDFVRFVMHGHGIATVTTVDTNAQCGGDSPFTNSECL
jgi:hypothetical protein